jgi:hypothetical protein
MVQNENDNSAQNSPANSDPPTDNEEVDYSDMPELIDRRTEPFIRREVAVMPGLREFRSPSPSSNGDEMNAATARRGNGGGRERTTGAGGNGGGNGNLLVVQTVLSEEEATDYETEEDEEPSLPERLYMGANTCRVIMGAGGKFVCGNDCVGCTRPTHAAKRISVDGKKCGQPGWYMPSPGKASPRGIRDGLLASYESDQAMQERRVEVVLDMDKAAANMEERMTPNNGGNYKSAASNKEDEPWTKVEKGGKGTKSTMDPHEEELKALEALPPPAFYGSDPGTHLEANGGAKVKKEKKVPLVKKEAALSWAEVTRSGTDTDEGRPTKTKPKKMTGKETEANFQTDEGQVQTEALRQMTQMLIEERKERAEAELVLMQMKKHLSKMGLGQEGETEQQPQKKKSKGRQQSSKTHQEREYQDTSSSDESRKAQGKPAKKTNSGKKGKKSDGKKPKFNSEDEESQSSDSSGTSSDGSSGRGRITKNSPEMGYALREPTKRTLRTTKKYYVFLRARKIGILADNWESRGKGYIHGFPNSYVKGFTDYREAKQFYCDAWGRKWNGGNLSDESDDTTGFPNKGGRKSRTQQERDDPWESKPRASQGHNRTSNSDANQHPPPERTSQGNQWDAQGADVPVNDPRFTLADRSEENDKICGVSMNAEPEAYKLLLPPGISGETGRSLINGAIDMTSLPGKNAGGVANGLDSAADMVQELAKTMVEGLQGEAYRVEGRVRADPNYGSLSRNFLAKIKSLEDLRDAQDKIYANNDEVWEGFKSTVQTLLTCHEGWSQDSFDTYFASGALPHLLRQTQRHYESLLMEAERLCTGNEWTDEAELFLSHHAERLGTIRSISSRTRLQLLWRNYTYLRNGQRERFISSSLQNKRAKAMRVRLEQMEERMEASNRQPRRPGTPGTRPLVEGEFKCGRCKSDKVHPSVGAMDCPFKNFRFRVSKLMGKTAEGLMAAGKSNAEAISAALEKHKHEV